MVNRTVFPEYDFFRSFIGCIRDSSGHGGKLTGISDRAEDLVHNGDFSATDAGAQPEDWLTDGTTNELNVVSESDSYAIEGNTLYLHQRTYDPVYYTLSAGSNGLVDGVASGATYLIQFDYRTDNSFFFQYYAANYSNIIWQAFGSQNGDPSSLPGSFDNTNTFPPSPDVFTILEQSGPEFTVNGDAGSVHYFSFGTMDDPFEVSEYIVPQKAYIDNFRIVRTDIPPRLSLSPNIEDTLHPLLSGSYRFSVWVKTDPEAGRNNRYHAAAITLRITGGGGTAGWIEKTVIYSAIETDWSDWTRLTVDTDNIQIPVSSTEPAMTVSVAPTDYTSQGVLSNIDAGSILVTGPHLELFPDGFP